MICKSITRESLDEIIKTAQRTKDWSEVENADVSEVINMSCVFQDVCGVSDLDLSSWDTSNAKDMTSMFADSDFNSPLFFNTSNVTNMSFMFSFSKYNRPLNSFDTSKVTCMTDMFSASQYNHHLDNFDTSMVTNMNWMFEGSEFNHPLKNFNCSSIREIISIFDNSCYTHPFFQIEKMDTSIKGYDQLKEEHFKNNNLHSYIKTGECDDLNKLMIDFKDNKTVLAKIKKYYLYHTAILSKEKITKETSAMRM